MIVVVVVAGDPTLRAQRRQTTWFRCCRCTGTTSTALGLSFLFLLVLPFLHAFQTLQPQTQRRVRIQNIHRFGPRNPTLTTTTFYEGGTKGATVTEERQGQESSQNESVQKSAQEEEDDVVVVKGKGQKRQHFFTAIPRKALHIYVDYASRLWKETNPEVRKTIASDKTESALRQVQQYLIKLKTRQEEEQKQQQQQQQQSLSSSSSSAALEIDEDGLYAQSTRDNLLSACHDMLQVLEKEKSDRKLQGQKNNKGILKKLSTIAVNAASTVTHVGSTTTTTSHGGPSSSVIAEAENHVASSKDTMVVLVEPNTGSMTHHAVQAEAVDVTTQTGIEVMDNSKALTTTMDPSLTVQALESSKQQQQQQVPVKKKGRSVLFGAVMGGAVACWVFSGNYVFTGLFTLMTVLGQLEYYRMVQSTGVYPARRISIVGACSMFLTALLAPDLHQICLPLFGMWAMIWFLTVRRTVTTISEIATTFTGMFYLGYVPSFWVRIRLIGSNVESRASTRLATLAAPFLNYLQGKAQTNLPAVVPVIHLPITTGAIFIFWTWLALAFSDVGAYFVGKNFGKHKLGTISPAAGATSPNKTIEGVLGGCAFSAVLSILGAWVQKWPYWLVTGAIHGTLLGLLGLLGDLTASMLKRDAGLKDFGDLIPEHGGIMDRVDSFIWTAPYSWLVCVYIIPALRTLAMAR